MLAKSKVVYVAGPMTGLPFFNTPAFDRQTARLRAEGYKVISPAEEDSPEMQVAARASKDGAMGADGKLAGETWADVLARDVKIIADRVDAICVLPGWAKSRGARLEVFVAMLCDKPILEDKNYAEAGAGAFLVAIPRIDVVFAIARSFL